MQVFLMLINVKLNFLEAFGNYKALIGLLEGENDQYRRNAFIIIMCNKIRAVLNISRLLKLTSLKCKSN